MYGIKSAYFVSLVIAFVCQLFCCEARYRPSKDSISTTPTPVTSQHFTHHDCGNQRSRRLRFLNITVSPSPIRAPGRVRLSAQVNVTEQLPTTLSADVIVSKYIYGIPVKIPCYRNVGTCHYKDVCGLLETMFPTNDRCPRVLKRHGIPCRCPFGPGVYSLKRWLIYVPSLGGMLESIATGEYDVRLRLYDSTDKSELSCVQLKFNLKQQRKRKPKTKTTTKATKTTTTTTTNDI